MNDILLSQWVGIISIFLIFCIKFWIAINPSSSMRTLRAAILWFSVYVFFLFILRILQLFHIGTNNELRIISGWATLIPLTAIIVHLYLDKRIDRELKKN